MSKPSDGRGKGIAREMRRNPDALFWEKPSRQTAQNGWWREKVRPADCGAGAVVLNLGALSYRTEMGYWRWRNWKAAQSLETILQLDVILQTDSVLPPSPVTVPNAGHT